MRSGAVHATADDGYVRGMRARWLGRVPYAEAWDLQRALAAGSDEDYLLLVEHGPTYTLGVNADPANVLVEPADVGAELLHVDRGGDVTFHGPGQLVGYPVRTVGAGPHHGSRGSRISPPDRPSRRSARARRRSTRSEGLPATIAAERRLAAASSSPERDLRGGHGSPASARRTAIGAALWSARSIGAGQRRGVYAVRSTLACGARSRR